ncbi:MAG TPA: hypothetical protein VFM05_12090, partial [Candidatus Saccharimonadales bacterium]|nr:hypothetical protein [Candidatus Saccharimonadales bacterium]
RDYLLETVDPVIADPAFEGRIPTELRAALIRGAHGIALRVNASHAGPASITQYRNRLGGYLREALRR